MALQNADSRIDAFDAALKSGSPEQIRRSALELQKDPLAVRRVNENHTNGFKTQLNQELNAIQSETKAKVRREIAAHYGVSEDDVTFFEATNPTEEIKVGQDWDVTAQVKGKDVPLKVSQQIVHDSFYEAAHGRKAATPEEATRFAHQQAVEVTNRRHAEAYGGGGKREVTNPKTGETATMTEGGEIIVGDKGQPMRDSEQLTNVMRHKSEIAKNSAQDFRDAAEAKIKNEGLSGEEADALRLQADADAQAWEMEQARQHAKQQSRQMQPRVEAMGGEVPEKVRRGNAILDRVGKGEISPAEGRRQLAEIGETPESIIEKGAGLHEAAQKLKSPSERIAQAEALKASGRDDVLTDNVRERMEINELERRAELKREGLSDAEIDQRMQRNKSESLAEVRARARDAGIDVPDNHLMDGGKTSVKAPHSAAQTMGAAVEAVQAVGDAAEVYQQEAEEAAREGREKDGAAMATELGRRALGGTEYDMGHKISSDEIAASDTKGESRIWALGRSVRENIRQRFGGGAYDMSRQINEEEAQAEVERAAAEGREASALNAKVNAATRVAGEMTGMRQIGDAVYYDEDADRQMHETQRKVQDKAKGKLQQGILKTGELEDRMQDLMDNWDTSDPAIRAELDELRDQHERERAQLQEHAARLETGDVIDKNDPEYIALQRAAGLVPEMSAEKVEQGIRDAAANKMQEALAQLNCDEARNTYPLWDDARSQAYCGCLKGQVPNAEGVCGKPQPEDPRKKPIPADACAHKPGTHASWNHNGTKINCWCSGGLFWNKTKGRCAESVLNSRNAALVRGSGRTRNSGNDMSGVVSGLTALAQQRNASNNSSTYQRPTGTGYNGIFAGGNTSAPSGYAQPNPVYNGSAANGGSYAGFGQGAIGQNAVNTFYGGSQESSSSYSGSTSSANSGAYDLGSTAQQYDTSKVCYVPARGSAPGTVVACGYNAFKKGCTLCYAK